MDILKEIEIVKQLASILKTNVRACKALNHAYVLQLGRIYLDMLNVYKVSLILEKKYDSMYIPLLIMSGMYV